MRTDIESILFIGSGPIVIGQACEFDYSGTQACRVLRAEGYRVILVNSNPATIMTDPELADATYIEPLDLDTLTRVIEKERPDALLPTLGGQTARSWRWWRPTASPPARWGRSSSSSRSPAGRNTSSRSCGTARITQSWSVPSRTSTRWAPTPATRSRSPPPRR